LNGLPHNSSLIAFLLWIYRRLNRSYNTLRKSYEELSERYQELNNAYNRLYGEKIAIERERDKLRGMSS